MLSGKAAAVETLTVYPVDVPAGSLADALDRLAASSVFQVSYDPAVVSGQVTGGVKGNLSLSQVFERLLAGTGVTYQLLAGDAVALHRREAPAADGAQRATGPPATSQPLSVVLVDGQRLNSEMGEGGAAALTALKADTPILASPVTFQSVPQSVLRDLQAERIEDVLENVSGIERAPDGQDTGGFVIRGIPSYQYYVNGVRVSPDLHHDAFPDLADVASIDVIKGPASTLYGRTEPGGLINIVTKQPLGTPYLALDGQTGSFNHRRSELDSGGPLDESGDVRYRFNAAWESSESHREDLSNRRIFLAPVVTWGISTRSALTGYVEYLRSDDPTDSGLPIVGSSLPAVPAERRVEDGGTVHTRDIRTGVRGWYMLNERWTVRYHFDGRWLRTPQSPQLVLADDGLDSGSCSRSSCQVDQLLFSIPVSRGQTYFSSIELLGDLHFLGARHAILVGGEFFDVRGYAETLFSDATFTTDLYSPTHRPVPGYLLQTPDFAYATSTSERWSGTYLQDQIDMGGEVYVLLGVRYDHAREWLDVAAGFPLQDQGSDKRWDHAFKRHAGVVWRAAAPLSLYANYAENFGISLGIYGNGTGGIGTLVPPETAHEWEVGAKSAFLDGKVFASLVWFDLTELNISLPSFFSVQAAPGTRTVTGAEGSRGVELDFRGQILPTLQLSASYSYLETRIVSDVSTAIDPTDGTVIQTAGNTGHRLFGAPRHGGSAWVTFTPAGPLRGVKLGVGAIARAAREGDNDNDYTIPGFVRCGLLAAYEWPWAQGRLTAQLNVDNVFNTRYFESIGGTHTVMPGAPRRWFASLRWTADPRR